MKSKKNYYLLTFFSVLISILVILRLIIGGTGGGIWNILQIFFVVSGLILLIQYYNEIKKSPLPLKLFVFFGVYIWLQSLYYVITNSNIDSYYYFIVVPFAPMIVIIFYHYMLRNDISNNKLIYISTFYIVSVLFFTTRQSQLNRISDEIVFIANSYYTLALLPLVLIYTKKKYEFLPFLVVFASILISSKRAGMLALVLMLLVYFLSVNKKNIRKTLSNIIGLGVLVFFAYYLYFYFEEKYSFDYMSSILKLQEDGGSGRDLRWEKVISGIISSHPFNFLFGHGFKSISDFAGGNAHNDFLEIFYEFGLFAFLLYLYFYISMFKTYLAMRKKKYPYSKHFVLSIIAAIFLANFSFFIIEPRFITFSALSWGIFLADWKKFQNSNYIIKT